MSANDRFVETFSGVKIKPPPKPVEAEEQPNAEKQKAKPGNKTE